MKKTLLKSFPDTKALNTFLMTTNVQYVNSYVFEGNIVLVFATILANKYYNDAQK